MGATAGGSTASDLPEVGMSSQGIAQWKAWVAKCNPRLTDLQLELVVRWVIAYSAIYGVDHRLSFAMIEAESGFDPMCLSHAGAMGMTQLMPCNLEDMGVDNPWNVQQNIRGGIRLLSEELRKFAGRSNYEQCILGLAAYNAGPNAVKKYGGVPPYKETQNYVRKVSQRFYELVQAGYP
jgi:soluble lytic murein transglycosylase-like protein